MEVNGHIGKAAGKVWSLLSGSGPLTTTQIRRKLNESSDLLNLALGWLAREDKVILTRERTSLRVQLR
jgi:hypothetical protein